MLAEAHDLAVVLSIIANFLFQSISFLFFYFKQCEHKKEIEEIKRSTRNGSF